MPQMWRLRFQWKDNQEPPQTQELAFVASEEDAIPELNNAISEIASSQTLGESLTMNATRLGNLRGTPG
jgi:hypothetical protein